MNEISWALAGGIAVVSFPLGFWTAVVLKRKETDRAVNAAQRTARIEQAEAAALTRRNHEKEIHSLKQQHAAEITTMAEQFAQQLEAAKAQAFKEGKESDGMYRGEDGTGRMVSAKKSAVKSFVEADIKQKAAAKAPAKAVAKKPCARKVTK